MARSVGVALRSYRRSHGVTQLVVATDLGISPTMLGRLESGFHHPRPPLFRKVLSHIGMPSECWADFVAPVGFATKGSFGHVLRAQRYAAGLTSVDVSDALLIEGMTLYRWEAERTTPNSSNLPAIAELIGADLDELIRLCPTPSTARNRPGYSLDDLKQWAADALDEASRGLGTHERLADRWNVTAGVTAHRLRVLRRAGYVGPLKDEWPTRRP